MALASDSRASHGGNAVASPSDGSLLRRYKGGAQDAATELYLRYAGRLIALTRRNASPVLASRFDPEDVVQSVFRTFFRRAADGNYSGPAGDELWQLLLTICLNKIRALGIHHRAQKRDVLTTQSMDRFAHTIAAVGDDAEPALRVLELVVEDALSELSEMQRVMIELRIEGHEIAEIATRTERSKRTVERSLEQFRRRLTEMLDE